MTYAAQVKPMLKQLYTLFFVISFSLGFSQKKDTVYRALDPITAEIKELQKKVFESKKEADRFEANKTFLKLWDEALRNPSSMEYSFDSIKGVSSLMSHDKKFRIITWNGFVRNHVCYPAQWAGVFIRAP